MDSIQKVSIYNSYIKLWVVYGISVLAKIALKKQLAQKAVSEIKMLCIVQLNN